MGAELGDGARAADAQTAQVVRVRLSPAAAADLLRLREFLAEKDEHAAQRAILAVLRAIRSLTTLPERGRKATLRGFRELVVPFGRSAYIVRYVYRARIREVVVVRIWHGLEDRG